MQDDTQVITAGEVSVIRAAIDVIERAGKRSDHMGRFAETCETATGTLFRVLNIAHSYYDVTLTYEQLHGHRDPTTVEGG